MSLVIESANVETDSLVVALALMGEKGNFQGGTGDKI